MNPQTLREVKDIILKYHKQKRSRFFIQQMILGCYGINLTYDEIYNIRKYGTTYHPNDVKFPTKSVDNKRMDNIKKAADLAINKAGEAMNTTMNVAKSVADLAIDNANKHFKITEDIQVIKDDITKLQAISKELVDSFTKLNKRVNYPAIIVNSTPTRERWKPKKGDIYFTYHFHLKNVYSCYWKGYDNNIDEFSIGNVFKTAKEAQAWGDKWVKRMQEEAGNE